MIGLIRLMGLGRDAEFREKRKALSDFDESVSRFESLHQLWQERHEPIQQSSARGVADPWPKQGRTCGLASILLNEVFIFGDEDGLMQAGIFPDGGVFGVPQGDIFQMLSLVAGFAQCHC